MKFDFVFTYIDISPPPKLKFLVLALCVAKKRPFESMPPRLRA
jgi:hypothetical protein